MAEENKQQSQNKSGSQNSAKYDASPQSSWDASSEYGKASDSEAGDHVDESAATYVYPADLGYTLTSHGDGQPSISPDYVEAREDEAARNADPDHKNREVARSLGLSVD